MRPTILIVDDEVNNLMLMEDYLSDLDVDILQAEDGVQAWDILSESHEKISLILLDRIMPNMNGMEVIAKAKKHDKISKIPIIMQTASGSTEEIREGVSAGVYYYLVKPYDCGMMQALVRAALEDHKSTETLINELAKYKNLMGLMDNCQLSFQTLSDAQNLSTLLANCYPNPDNVVSGIRELLINAVEHGNLGISFNEKSKLMENNSWHSEIQKRLNMPEYKNKFAQVSFKKSKSEITLTVEDAGDGFEWERYLELSPDTLSLSHGRGIPMCNDLFFDELEFQGKGNKVLAKINL